MRRSDMTWTRIIAVGVLLPLVACSSSQTDELSASAASSAAASSTDPADLREVDWLLREVVEDGVRRDVADVDAVVRVDREDRLSGQGCNSYGGAAEVGPGTLRVAESMSTLMGCTGPSQQLDELVQRVLRAGATWTVEDGVLRIRGSGTDLVLRDRGTPFRRQGTTLVDGTFGDAVYRLSWSRSATSADVVWESRDRPGVGLGFSGLGRPLDEKITYLDPSGTAVAGRGFVFVPAPLSVERVAFQRADGGSIDLKRFTLDGVTTWALHAGFVEGVTRGGRTIGYDGAGAEVLRSRDLP